MFKIYLPKIVLAWLPFAGLVIIMSVTGFAIVQQSMRLSANEPQIQIAEAIINAIGQGQDPKELFPGTTVDMTKSLESFAIIYDTDGKVLSNSITLDGSVPDLPKEALSEAKKHGDNRITWEPKKGVRNALIIKPFESQEISGFVAIGRSLSEVDNRIKTIGYITLLGMVLSLFVSLFLVTVAHYYFVRSEGKEEVDVVIIEEDQKI